MALCCAAIRRDSGSGLSIPFCSHVHDVLCEIYSVYRKKHPYLIFLPHFCFLFIVVLLIIVLFMMFLVAVISLSLLFST